MTASPSSRAKNNFEMNLNITSLCSLIEGVIRMPVIFKKDFEEAVNRPEMTFIEAKDHPDEASLIALINTFILPFTSQLNATEYFKSKIDIKNREFKGYINNILREPNIQNNLKRFTLANFLQSISSSIEIMKIIGLTKAIEFLDYHLKAELEKTKKNKIWSNLDVENIINFNQKINCLNGTSEKITILTNMLKDKALMKHQSRIIVFVRARKTARCLCEYLDNDEAIKKHWKPKIFVGHGDGGLDGMDWYEDQEPVLNKFNEGQCRLLVATNVLQEGLDVQICDRIILFDPLWSLTEYVQSRGRARHKSSQFIVIDSKKQKDFYCNLIELEKELIRQIDQISKQNEFIDRGLIDQQIRLINQTEKKSPMMKWQTLKLAHRTRI